MKKIAFYGAVLLAGAFVAHADTLITTQPTPTDTLNWSQFGPDGTAVFSNDVFRTTNGVEGLIRLVNYLDGNLFNGNSYGTGTVAVANGTNSPNTDFPVGDYLLNEEGLNPILLFFIPGIYETQDYYEIGAEIQSEDPGPFVAGICDIVYYNTPTCFTKDSDAMGDAMYLGIESDRPFNAVSFGLGTDGEQAKLGQASIAIDQVILVDTPEPNLAATPEPSSVFLLGTGLLLGLVEWRTRSGNKRLDHQSIVA